MKHFTIIKTGYTAGIYGNSGEYFTCIFTDKKGLKSFKFNGQYGAEERVARLMESKGFTGSYCQAEYGQLKHKDIAKGNNYSEEMVKHNIDELLKHAYIEVTHLKK